MASEWAMQRAREFLGNQPQALILAVAYELDDARRAGLEEAADYVVAIDGQQHPGDMAASIRKLGDSTEGGDAADGG